MRKALLFLGCFCILTCGLTACRSGGAQYQPKYDGSTVAVEKRQVASGKVAFQGILDRLDALEGNESRPIKKSYVFEQEQSYQKHWYRVVYYTYPQFTDEIEGDGAKEIKRYYRQQYNACTAAEDFPWLKDSAEVKDDATDILRYRLQTYSVEVLKKYVAVKFYRESFTEGKAPEMVTSADVFDLASGKKLTLHEVVDVKINAKAINQAVADTLRFADIQALKPYDVMKADHPMFSLTEKGVVLLFAPGELAHKNFGKIESLVAWDVLAS